MGVAAATGSEEPRFDIFLSYAHRDQDAVRPIAAALNARGYAVWLDSTHLRAGDSIVQAIHTALSRANVYLVFLSKSALASNWVRQELDTALALTLSTGSPLVIPVVLESVDLPPQLASRLYLDARGTLSDVTDRLDRELAAALGREPVAKAQSSTKPRFSSARFTLYADTHRAYGGLGEHEERATREEATKNMQQLRRRANGVLLNFVDADEVAWQDPAFKFPNGEITERVDEIGGPFTGSLAFRSVIEVSVLNPDESKFETLVSTQLKNLGVLDVSYEFTLGAPVSDLSARVLRKLQKRYQILGWDQSTGAEVALPDDVRLTVRTTSELVEVKIETQHPFQLERGVKGVSVREFVDWLVE
jgi:hypothetical protein